MVGSIGGDDAGKILLATLADDGVDTTGVRRVDEPSGLATIGSLAVLGARRGRCWQ